jgi:cytochrome c oxidase subunit 2
MRRMFTPLILLAALLATASLPHGVFAQEAPRRIEISAKRFAFTPSEITLKKGQPVVLVLTSTDVKHGLRIKEFGVNVTIKPGSTAKVEFTPDKTGDFVGHCSQFCGSGHGSMEIKIHVVG